MLQLLLVLGTVYVLYKWGVREMIRSRLTKSRVYDRVSYLIFLAAGSTLALFLSFHYVFPFLGTWSIWTQSLLPTITGIWLGEFLYARNLAITLRMLKQLRKKGGQTNE
jgi:hypothetical protein